MPLSELLQISKDRANKKKGLSEERIRAVVPIVRQYVAYWREYPDMFAEFLCGDNPQNFSLYFYQRCFIRASMRHRFVYATFPRAYSKSFLSVLVLILRCILYPDSHLFVASGGKEQSAGILQEKVDQLCKLIPGIRNEIDFSRGQSKMSKDNIEIRFKNGSKLDVMAASERSRGKRATGGLLEECVSIDQNILNEVLIPTLNVDRRLADGSRHEQEVANKSQIYITTAGYKNSFAYDKQMELLVRSIMYPDEAFVMGGTWRVPVMEGLQPKNFINQLRNDGTYNDESFAREYESSWAGDSEHAYFSSEKFDKHRVLLQPEYQFSERSSKSAYYVLGVDVGRKGLKLALLKFL